MTSVSATLIVNAAHLDEAEVRVHETHDGLALAAVTVAGLTLQSAIREPSPFGYEHPAGGPDVLADFLEALAAKVREQYALWLERGAAPATDPEGDDL